MARWSTAGWRSCATRWAAAAPTPAPAKPTPPPAPSASTAEPLDALVPAFVAALLAGIGDRPAWLAAILATRTGQAPAVVAGSALALALAAGIAAAGGAWIGPMLSPAARSILLGMALLAAAGAAWPTRTPASLDRWQAFPAALAGTAALAVNDSAIFIVFALAARSPAPALAAIGGFAGALILISTAAALGERCWTALPRRALALGGGAVLLATGLICLLGGLRLI